MLHPALKLIATGLVTMATTSSAASASAHDGGPETQFVRDSSELAEMSCPVDGESTFDDSWGAARSGGRRHQGVDMIADRGTPVVAAVAGDAEFKMTSAGGRSVWLATLDGGRFFYAHLDDWEGESRRVEQGEVIGYVGSTGNAGGPHLHFEVHPHGVPQNPFTVTDRACRNGLGESAADTLPGTNPETPIVIAGLGSRPQ